MTVEVPLLCGWIWIWMSTSTCRQRSRERLNCPSCKSSAGDVSCAGCELIGTETESKPASNDSRGSGKSIKSSRTTERCDGFRRRSRAADSALYQTLTTDSSWTDQARHRTASPSAFMFKPQTLFMPFFPPTGRVNLRMRMQGTAWWWWLVVVVVSRSPGHAKHLTDPTTVTPHPHEPCIACSHRPYREKRINS